MSPSARLFSVTAFPFVFTATLAGTLWLLDRGVDPALAIAPGTALAYAFVAGFERVFPLHRSWLHSTGDLRVDTALFATNTLVIATTTPIVVGAAIAFGGWLAETMGAGLWPLAWPVLAQLALALVIAEAVEYSVHRAMHEVPWLWRFHATHHSAPRLYWLNAVRFHPIDLFLVGVGKLVPLAVLGAGPEVLALVNLVSGVHGTFQHANLPLRLGPLNWVFSMAELHRWHHSKRIEEANTNYGGNLIVWDVLFGTRFLPDRAPPEAIGIADLPAFPAGFVDNLLAPFRWKSIEARSRGAS
ncbi:MAG: sterol desaturase family protein [Myxococcota bacterium]|nr:sterol desaturase family protein [Myxococcota bacterium]